MLRLILLAVFFLVAGEEETQTLAGKVESVKVNDLEIKANNKKYNFVISESTICKNLKGEKISRSDIKAEDVLVIRYSPINGRAVAVQQAKIQSGKVDKVEGNSFIINKMEFKTSSKMLILDVDGSIIRLKDIKGRQVICWYHLAVFDENICTMIQVKQ